MAKRALALFLGAFALYALTAQRGLGWGDSGEFQYRILTLGADGLLGGCDSFATAHPLYVALAKIFCSTPFQVTLLSAFFGAVAVALLYLLTRNLPLAILFALGHGLWWLSSVSEVYTMSLAFFAGELLALRRFEEKGSVGALFALAALNGLHLEIHNFALLAIPVYAWVVGRRFFYGCGQGSASAGRRGKWPLLGAALLWCFAASFWLWAFFTLGPRAVLFGRYGAQVLTLKPILPAAIPLNLGLGALSLAVPVVLFAAKGGRREAGDGTLLALFAIHFLFWSTYFVVSQYTFVLPSVLLAYLLVRDVRLSRRAWLAVFVLQLALPPLAWGALTKIGFPADYRAQHPGREDAAYFALPWHVTDRSADRAAAAQPTPWKGYP